MTNQRRRLGEMLISAGILNEMQLRTALNNQEAWGGKLGSTLVRLGFVKEEELLRCLSAQLRLPSVDFSKAPISPRALQLVPARVAEKYTVIPVAVKEELGKKSVILAMSDPTNAYAISEIQFQTGVTIRPVVATEASIKRAIDEHYRAGKGAQSYGYTKTVDFSEEAADEMVIYQKGEEKVVGPLDGLDALDVVHLLVRVLQEKGVITAADLEAAARKRR